MTYNHGAWQPPGGLEPFSVAPWLSLDYQIPQGAEGVEELGRWAHMTLNVHFGPWELCDLGKLLTSGSFFYQDKMGISSEKEE